MHIFHIIIIKLYSAYAGYYSGPTLSLTLVVCACHALQEPIFNIRNINANLNIMCTFREKLSRRWNARLPLLLGG